MSSDFGEFLPSEGACGTGFVAAMNGLPSVATDGCKLLGLRRSCLGGRAVQHDAFGVSR